MCALDAHINSKTNQCLTWNATETLLHLTASVSSEGGTGDSFISVGEVL